MRPINTIILHCSYTPPSMDIGVAEIRRWHVGENGWSDIGYHYVIRRNGELEAGRPVGSVGAHAKGHNTGSIGVCLVGGMAEGDQRPDCNFSRRQWDRLDLFARGLLLTYPGCTILGHRDVAPGRACPTFDAKAWAAGL
jgi:N-acetyl-anhydromuramyl-L-alanine amidase AmpD